ncbi:MAG: RNA-directed DNA polymerase, partial [Inquilinus sp.]|nr:RNA-directed DNA polymerase [Inquilinus sp.]
MTSRRHIARMLAMAWCAGPWARDDLRVTAEALLGAGRRRAIGRLVDDVLAVVPTPYAPPFETLARFIGPLPSFEAATAAARSAGLDGPTLAPAPAFRPLPPFADLPVPRLVSPADLAEWLGLLPPELDWFADTRRQHGVTEKRPLQHYSYAWVPKRRGAPRLIEAPKPRLKALQRQILRDILDPIPVHEAAHGFVKGRSCLGGAARHGGEAVVATLDLVDFFPSVPLERVHGIFRCLGYPGAVARLLTGLCSTTTPRGVLAAAPGPKRRRGAFVPEAAPHLPQGAP